MKNRYRLYRRKLGGVFYVRDSETGKQESLGTRDRAEATTLLNARNESVRQPQLNLHIAKAYLAGTDSGISTRTWKNALDAIVETKTGLTKDRWCRAAKETCSANVQIATRLTRPSTLFPAWCVKSTTIAISGSGSRIT